MDQSEKNQVYKIFRYLGSHPKYIFNYEESFPNKFLWIFIFTGEN